MARGFIVLADDFKALENKISEIKSDLGVETDFLNYDMNEDDFYALIDEITTVSLFSEPKFIVVRNSEKLFLIENKQFEELLKSINTFDNEDAVVFCFMNYTEQSKTQFQKLKNFTTVLDVSLKNINLEDYAAKRFADLGYVISPMTVKLLVSLCDNLTKLETSIDQLESYKACEKKIEDADINIVVSTPLDENVYDLIDAVLVDDKNMILQRYHDLKLKSIQPSFLVSLLIAKFQELYNVAVLIQNGYNQSQIASLLNVSSGRAYYMIKNAKSFDIRKIQKHLDLLNDLDFKIKSGKIEQNLGLELYFLI